MKTTQIRRAVAVAVQMCALTALTSLYLAGAANPQPAPPAPVTVRPATPAEDAAWQVRQLRHRMDEISQARQ